MRKSFLLAGVACFTIGPIFSAAADSSVENVVVTAQKLGDARSGIQTQTGASTYTITEADIENAPGGDNSMLNQVVLQAPDVAQDSFGQLHVRGEHNGLQYRLNGIILPEGISVFGQTFDPRLISSMKLITGALPAEYGLRTAGIIDLQTKSGLFDAGGEISMYGGSHSELAPSVEYGGSSGSLNYFVSGDYMTNTLGIESPDGSANPIHDRTNQYHGFAFLQDIINDHSSITAILGTSNDKFEIPNSAGLQPGGLDGINGMGPGGLLLVNGQYLFPSNDLNERQREITHYGIVSYLHSAGQFDFQISGFARYSSLNFSPDVVGDLLFDGIAQQAVKQNTSFGMQSEGAWHLGDTHTIRGGVIIETDRAISKTDSMVLPVDSTTGDQTSDVPLSIIDNGAQTQWTYSAYIQDEWKLLSNLTVNYGLRFDTYKGFASESQLSPRLNVVWQPADGTTVHAGYSRYFSPPPFELIGAETVQKFACAESGPEPRCNTASPASTTNDVSKAERANYFDIGASQQFGDTLLLGVDSYYKQSRNLIDEGQFGAPIILTPFNYKTGKNYGVEFTGTYNAGPFSAYGNVALAHAEGKDIVSSQFQFASGDLAYIADHFVHVDHEQYLTMSGGASYLWDGTRFSTDLIYGSGLRKDGAVPNGAHVPGYTQVNAGVSHDFADGMAKGISLRFDVINVFDKKYEIRDGSGIGVGAPQFGPRRGFFMGISEAL
ncbi:MAG TPA: TonB-dependent receptor [Rhizomicrobium sp.]|nr:TonB-dependent receptor [Rhizomicrobium sp.]